MFTQLSKVVLWIGLIGCFIFSIILGVSTQEDWGIWLTLGGWVATLVIFSGFGMIVELANNIKDSRDFLKDISKNSITQANNTSGSYDLTALANETKAANTQPPAANVNRTSQEPWICPKCGHSNLGSYKFCEDCDARKPSGASAQTPDNNGASPNPILTNSNSSNANDTSNI